MNTDFKIKWSILTKAHTFLLGGKKCELCLTEKTIILLNKDRNTLLNQQDEILTKYRHKEAHCLSSVKQQQPPTTYSGGPKRIKYQNTEYRSLGILTEPNQIMPNRITQYMKIRVYSCFTYFIAFLCNIFFHTYLQLLDFNGFFG